MPADLILRGGHQSYSLTGITAAAVSECSLILKVDRLLFTGIIEPPALLSLCKGDGWAQQQHHIGVGTPQQYMRYRYQSLSELGFQVKACFHLTRWSSKVPPYHDMSTKQVRALEANAQWLRGPPV